MAGPTTVRAPVEAKVTAGAAGAGAGAGIGIAVAAFVVYLLGIWPFHGPVPVPVTDLVMLVVPIGAGWAGSYIVAWLAPHTLRPDLENAKSPPSS